MFMGQFKLYGSKSGNLAAYHNSEQHEYQYIGDDVFQDLTNLNTYIVFKRNNREIASMHRNVNIMGIVIPASYVKLSWFERPRFLNDEYPYLLIIMLSYLLIPFLWIFRYFIRKKKPEYLRKQTVRTLDQTPRTNGFRISRIISQNEVCKYGNGFKLCNFGSFIY